MPGRVGAAASGRACVGEADGYSRAAAHRAADTSEQHGRCTRGGDMCAAAVGTVGDSRFI